MDAKGSFLTIFSLMIFLCYQHSAAHPIHNLSPAEELANMEALLERLEEKVALMEDLQGNSNEFEIQGESQAEEDINDQPAVEDAFPVFSDTTSLLKHMRGIQAAKSMRESGCFGRRLDRIGSVSGMGCKGVTTDGTPHALIHTNIDFALSRDLKYAPDTATFSTTDSQDEFRLL
ncbi:natriuretic peptides B [Candoia aspera]|uniref:natriuretic peptides B n=1 Tax=Candoia aspera TaxID=51853 RepID=UPI002FD85015